MAINFFRDHREYHAMACIWRVLRRPFMVPCGLNGHDCDAFWEKIDVDIAGCKQCGNIHVCRENSDMRYMTTSRQEFIHKAQSVYTGLNSIHSECILEDHDDCSICKITGFCIKNKTFAATEFSNNVSVDIVCTDVSSHLNSVEWDYVCCNIHHVLSSEHAEECFDFEKRRIQSRLSVNLMKIMRDYKVQNPGKGPNMVVFATQLANISRNIRLCGLHFDYAHRLRVCSYCSMAISHFLRTLQQSCPHIFTAMKQDHLIVGLLYLMRVGLNVNGIVILPVLNILHSLLPLESLLLQFFGVKAKCITEVENVIKVNLRSLTQEQVRFLCIQNSSETLLR